MKVRELLGADDRWCQGAFAKTHSGLPTAATAEDAVQWCLTGAVIKCYPPDLEYSILKKIEEELELPTPVSVEYWNDAPERVFGDIKKLIDKLDI